MKIPVAMTIAGSDPDGGAGIIADIKTFAALGVHGAAVITNVTAQNTLRMAAIHEVPPNVVKKQIEAVLEDPGVDAVKIGMLGSERIVETVAEVLNEVDVPIVLDPVMYAKNGAQLLTPQALDVLKKKLIPISTVVTPNRIEAEKLTGITITSIEDAKEAAKYIVEKLGAKAAIVKGGHIEGDEAVDVLYTDGEFYELRSPRIKTQNLHGTGCVFSAAITAELAKGKPLIEAVKTAKMFITYAIEYGLPIGRNYGFTNPMAWLEIPAEKYRVIEALTRCLNAVLGMGKLIAPYVPEVGTNIAMIIDPRYARTQRDVAAVKGRIVRFGDDIKPVGCIEFSASSHLARALLRAVHYDPSIRIAMNLRYDEALIKKAKERGLTVVFVDRRNEPEHIRHTEGASMPWIIDEAVRQIGKVPDIIYDVGDVGKEAMIRVFARDPDDLLRKLTMLLSDSA